MLWAYIENKNGRPEIARRTTALEASRIATALMSRAQNNFLRAKNIVFCKEILVMENQKKKLRLDELKVESFVTSRASNNMRGGTYTDNIGGCATAFGTCYWENCGFNTQEDICTQDTFLAGCDRTNENACTGGGSCGGDVASVNAACTNLHGNCTA